MSVEDNIARLENTPPKETPFSLRSRVVISGNPGTGTSTLLDRLALIYSLSEDRKIQVSSLFRRKSIEETGQDILGFYQRPDVADKNLDDSQAELLANPDQSHTFILESRLGGFLVRNLRETYQSEGKPPPSITTVLLTAEASTRYQRVFDRERQKRPQLTLDQLATETRQREEGDLDQWRKVHPALLDIDPLSVESSNIYDIHVDTTNLSLDQVVELVHTQLLSKGAVTQS